MVIGVGRWCPGDSVKLLDTGEVGEDRLSVVNSTEWLVMTQAGGNGGDFSLEVVRR